MMYRNNIIFPGGIHFPFLFIYTRICRVQREYIHQLFSGSWTPIKYQVQPNHGTSTRKKKTIFILKLFLKINTRSIKFAIKIYVGNITVSILRFVEQFGYFRQILFLENLKKTTHGHSLRGSSSNHLRTSGIFLLLFFYVDISLAGGVDSICNPPPVP